MTAKETIETAAYFQPVSGNCFIVLPFAKKHAGTEITAKTINAHTTTDRVCDKPAVHTQRASEGMSERRNMSSRREPAGECLAMVIVGCIEKQLMLLVVVQYMRQQIGV